MEFRHLGVCFVCYRVLSCHPTISPGSYLLALYGHIRDPRVRQVAIEAYLYLINGVPNAIVGAQALAQCRCVHVDI